ncbi:hypothetical protein O181_095134 [Austropuccinia psidii MF-1]|uniref:Integrase catalytic domain-containing protein n=1 Tax=Austropuccinia psidii MF-1 TaxID=1389203 RepID=A0A9Q3J4I1_9BASI|nr:hypothetical protein [Austropuccinia psidii MF-1]
MIWNIVINHKGLFQNIISDRNPKFTLALWTNLHIFFGTKLSFSKAYHPQTEALAEIMIQKLEGMIKRFCYYGLELKDSDCFTHDWCTLIPALELAYKTSVYSSTGKAPEMLEKASSFKIMLDKERHHAIRFIQDTFKYAKERLDKIHNPPFFKLGDLVLVSTLKFNDIKGQKKLKYSFEEPLVIRALHGLNAVQLELKGGLMNKNPAFPVSLIKPYSSSDKELFPLRNEPPLEIPPLEEGKEKKSVKALKGRRIRKKKEREYLFRFRNPAKEDEWILEKDITNADKLLIRFRK